MLIDELIKILQMSIVKSLINAITFNFMLIFFFLNQSNQQYLYHKLLPSVLKTPLKFQ